MNSLMNTYTKILTKPNSSTVDKDMLVKCMFSFFWQMACLMFVFLNDTKNKKTTFLIRTK